MPEIKKRIAVLASGSGTNLQAIINAVETGKLDYIYVAIVISNKKDAFALERAKSAGVKTVFVDPKEFKSNEEYDKRLIEVICNYNVDLIVLAGYMKILTESFINAFKNKIINIHPALLPDFGGKGMYGKNVHEAVLKSGVKESGCTVHFVTTEVDAGPVIAQRRVPVIPGDTTNSLSKRILKEEHKLLIEAIEKVFNFPRHCEEARSADEAIS